MTRTVTHHFPTTDYAEGFMDGVEWTNDSTIKWDDTSPDGLVVTYTDEDGDEDIDLYHGDTA